VSRPLTPQDALNSPPSRQTPEGTRHARPWSIWTIAVIGLALIVMPVAFGMFSKAPKGAQMMGQFKPFMTTPRLDGYQLELKEINAGVRQTNGAVAQALYAGRGGQAAFDRAFPNFASFDQQWPSIDRTMTTLMNEVQGNQGNYEAISALPSFNLFPWFFVGPGIVLVGLAALALWRPRLRPGARWVLVGFGVVLVIMPVAFGMFSRAPEGGQMMSAFTHIETNQNVSTIQGYFGTMAEGQGVIRLDIIPALESSGLGAAQVRTEFPAVATLDAQWVHILNDMTPMIGVMSDNVSNYQAVKSMPPFPLFPWFFVGPGLVVAGLALASVPRARHRKPETVFSGASIPQYQGAS
jgi:hypothetical protein